MHSSTNHTPHPQMGVLSSSFSHKLSPIFLQVEPRENVVSVLLQLLTRLLLRQQYLRSIIVKITKIIFWDLIWFYRKTNLSPVRKYLFLNSLLTRYWEKKNKRKEKRNARQTAWENFIYRVSKKEIEIFYFSLLFISYIIVDSYCFYFMIHTHTHTFSNWSNDT